MADGAVVREELWFDSADGTSRAHGLIWWPAGASADGLEEMPSPAEGLDDAGTDGAAGDGRPDDRGEDTPDAVDPDEGGPVADVADRSRADSSDDEASGPVAASVAQPPAIPNALEAAAHKVWLQTLPASVDDGQGGSDLEVADDDGAGAVEQGAVEPTDAVSADGELADPKVPMADGLGAAEGAEGDYIEVKGIVQLVHGMAEHIARYDEFARFLAGNGYIVCGHDHIGHGQSAAPERLGCIPARKGKQILIADVGRLRAIMQERLGDEIPYFLFGHSLGSFVVRAYIAREGGGLAGAIICGTGHVPPGKSSMAHFLCRLIGIVRGQNARSLMLHSMGIGPYVRSVKHRRTKNDWLSYREENVDAYNDDELCGFRFSAGGYATVTALTREVCSPAWAMRVPRLLPMLLIGGNADPVGDNGEGVRITAQMLRDAGCPDATCMIYRHMRHEILNEDDRQMVFDDVLFWLEVRS